MSILRPGTVAGRRLAELEQTAIEAQRTVIRLNDEVAQLHGDLQEAWDDVAFYKAQSEALRRRLERYRPKKKVTKKKV